MKSLEEHVTRLQAQSSVHTQEILRMQKAQSDKEVVCMDFAQYGTEEETRTKDITQLLLQAGVLKNDHNIENMKSMGRAMVLTMKTAANAKALLRQWKDWQRKMREQAQESPKLRLFGSTPMAAKFMTSLAWAVKYALEVEHRVFSNLNQSACILHGAGQAGVLGKVTFQQETNEIVIDLEETVATSMETYIKKHWSVVHEATREDSIKDLRAFPWAWVVRPQNMSEQQKGSPTFGKSGDAFSKGGGKGRGAPFGGKSAGSSEPPHQQSGGGQGLRPAGGGQGGFKGAGGFGGHGGRGQGLRPQGGQTLYSGGLRHEAASGGRGLGF